MRGQVKQLLVQISFSLPPHLATILGTLTALKTALTPLFTHKATTQRRQTRRQTTPVLLLLARRLLRRRLLVLHRRLLALRRVVAHGLLGRVALLRVVGLAAVAGREELVVVVWGEGWESGGRRTLAGEAGGRIGSILVRTF